MLARIENEIFSSRGDSLIFFFSLSLFWKLESIFFKFLPELFEFRIVSIGKSSGWDENKEQQATFHRFIFWVFGRFISLLLRKKIVCLETVNIKGKWKTNQKNNNNNIFFFFFFCARARNRLILNRWKLKNWRSTFVEKKYRRYWRIRLKWKLITGQREGKKRY